MLHRKLTSAGFDYVAGSLVCYAGAVLLLLFGIKAVTRFAERPFDIVVGLLAVSAVAISIASLGVLLSLGRDQHRMLVSTCNAHPINDA